MNHHHHHASYPLQATQQASLLIAYSSQQTFLLASVAMYFHQTFQALLMPLQLATEELNLKTCSPGELAVLRTCLANAV
jgi:hypothetical protein